MDVFFSLVVIVFLLLLIFLVAPVYMVYRSDRPQKGGKFIWFVIVFFFSWLGYLVFYYTTRDE